VPLACLAAFKPVRAVPEEAASAVSELLHGESFNVLDVRGEWAWGYCAQDDYVGYVPRDAIGLPTAPTFRTVHLAPLFSQAAIKSPILRSLPIGSLVGGVAEGDFLKLSEGFVHLRHVAPVSHVSEDWVAVARHYLGQPYVWGGRGGQGVDCSGLVQVALSACGIPCPRDSDQQAETVGALLDDAAQLASGDLVFFPGHVGMMVDGANLLHANAHWMSTVIEPLDDVVARLSPLHEQPILARRRITA
jgi:cell wall-associated NlpC family hydrolase